MVCYKYLEYIYCNILSNYDDFICFFYLKLFNRKLLISIPGISTHAMHGLESPSIDWNIIAKDYF